MYSKLDTNFKSVKEYLIIRPIIINIFCHYLSKIEEGVLLGYEMTTRKQMFFYYNWCQSVFGRLWQRYPATNSVRTCLRSERPLRLELEYLIQSYAIVPEPIIYAGYRQAVGLPLLPRHTMASTAMAACPVGSNIVHRFSS